MNEAALLKLIDRISEMMVQVRSAIAAQGATMPKEAMEKAEKGLCLWCGEPLDDGGKTFRGLHERHYKRVNRAINDGSITDAQAVARGYILPVTSKGGRKLAADDPIATGQAPPSPPKKKAAKRGRKKPG